MATNYSWRVIQPAVVIAATALITLWVTLAVTLKEVSWSEPLYTTLVVDQNGRPVFAKPAEPDVNLGLRLSAFFALAVSALKDKPNSALEIPESTLLHERIIQTLVMEALSGHYSEQWAVTFRRPTVLSPFMPGSIGVEDISTSAGSTVISAETLWREMYSKNPVAQKQEVALGRTGLTLPEGTSLTVHALRPTVPLFEPQPMFEFQKKRFFEVSISIAKSISRGPVHLPFEIVPGSDIVRNNFKAETYSPTVRAHFFAIRAGHPHMESFQQWARGLVDVLRFVVTD